MSLYIVETKTVTPSVVPAPPAPNDVVVSSPGVETKTVTPYVVLGPPRGTTTGPPKAVISSHGLNLTRDMDMVDKQLPPSKT